MTMQKYLVDMQLFFGNELMLRCSMCAVHCTSYGSYTFGTSVKNIQDLLKAIFVAVQHNIDILRTQ